MIVPFNKSKLKDEAPPPPPATYLMMAANLMHKQGRLGDKAPDPNSTTQVQRDMVNDLRS